MANINLLEASNNSITFGRKSLEGETGIRIIWDTFLKQDVYILLDRNIDLDFLSIIDELKWSDCIVFEDR